MLTHTIFSPEPYLGSGFCRPNRDMINLKRLDTLFEIRRRALDVDFIPHRDGSFFNLNHPRLDVRKIMGDQSQLYIIPGKTGAFFNRLGLLWPHSGLY